MLFRSHLDVALGGEVVDFVGPDLADDLQHRHRVAEVGIVEVEMRQALKMRYALSEVDAAASDGSMYVVALRKQKLSQERAVLTGYPGY